MHADHSRYTGSATIRQSYMKEFIVQCPKCQQAAMVTVDNPYFLTNGKLACSHCFHQEKARDLIRYQMEVKRYCDNCGQQWEKSIPPAKEKVHEITLACPNCGITRTFTPRHEEVRLTYNSSGYAADPVFQLPLWLQADVRDNLFWAYNRAHLQEIKAYVQAKLRERQTTTHTTMVERLPNFIKESKNRASLLKAIERLERK